MSWICEYCSTYNEDSVSECFVCGQARSEASLREAKRRQKEEREERVGALIYKWSMIVTRTLFISSTVLFSLFALIIVVMKLMSGDINDIANAIIKTGIHIGNNLISPFTVNAAQIAEHLSQSTLFELDKNIEFIFEKGYYTALPCLTFILAYGENMITDKISFLSMYREVSVNKVAVAHDGLVELVSYGIKKIENNVLIVIEKGKLIINKIGDKFSL